MRSVWRRCRCGRHLGRRGPESPRDELLDVARCRLPERSGNLRNLSVQAGVAVSDIDHFVFYQANERILSAAVKLLGVDDARVVRTLRSTGNISSACIPLALDSLVRSGELEHGELVALVGFGAGLDTGPACFVGSSDSHSKN